jgi:hypothetical protein
VKTPNTNIQVPENNQAPRLQARREASVWSLGFGSSLDVGVWNLELLQSLEL